MFLELLMELLRTSPKLAEAVGAWISQNPHDAPEVLLAKLKELKQQQADEEAEFKKHLE